MSLIVRICLIFLALLAAFWLLAVVVGWLWYVVVAVGVVAAIALVVWFFTQRDTSSTKSQPLTRNLEKKAAKELKTLEKRQKSGPQ